MTNNDADFEALKSFIDDNEDLERLEALADRFNMFEALGLVRQEIRHSAFLRWILDPAEPHGLGDYPLRQFVRQVIKSSEGISDNTPSLFDLDGWNLARAEVRKEWHHIDLLIVCEDHQFVCAIENKVDSGEGRGQLKSYERTVRQAFPEHQIAFVFLTISGYDPEPPSDKTWVPMSYGDIASIIENVMKRRESRLNDEIRLFVQQYLDMVRRHIVENSDIQELCRKLYQNHRRALDLIFEHRPDRAAEVYGSIQDCIGSRRGELISLPSNKSYIRFIPKFMDVLPRVGSADESSRLLTCALENRGGQVRFKLELGPGPNKIRQQVYEKLKELPEVFGSSNAKLSPQWYSFPGMRAPWIGQNEYDELSDEEIKERIAGRIDSLVAGKGKAIAEALRGIH